MAQTKHLAPGVPGNRSGMAANCEHPQVIRLLAESAASHAQGKLGLALAQAQRALQLARSEGSASDVATTLVMIATVHFRCGRYQDARTCAQQALDGAAPLSLARAAALNRLGTIAAETDDLPAAEELLRHAIDLYRQLGSQEGLFQTLHNLSSSVYLPRGQFALALAADEESYRLAADAGADGAAAASLITIAFAHEIMCERMQAYDALADLARLAPPASVPMGYQQVIAAELAMDADELDTAFECLNRARSIADASGEPSVNVLVRVGLSRWHRLNGATPAARDWASEAVVFAQRVGYRHFEGKALIARALVAYDAGDLPAVEADLRLACDRLTPLGAAYDLAYASLLRAALSCQLQRPDAEPMWLEAAKRIEHGGYAFLLERERRRAFPLVAAHLRAQRAGVREAAEVLLAQLERIPPLPLRIAGLGRFQVQVGLRTLAEPAWERRKAGALFRFLLLQPQRTAPREQVIEALWPGYAAASAQALFHQASSAVRRLLEPELPDKFPSRYILVEAERVSLRLPPGSQVDFEQFEQGARSAIQSTDIQGLEHAVALYADDLFAADRYGDWASAQRERLASLFLLVLHKLATLRLADGHAQQALDLCRRLLAREPWHEDAALLGMQAALRLRDRPAALRLYLELERHLQDELALAPRADLAALAAEIRRAR